MLSLIDRMTDVEPQQHVCENICTTSNVRTYLGCEDTLASPQNSGGGLFENEEFVLGLELKLGVG